jgi:CSLREA domain-containing protein
MFTSLPRTLAGALRLSSAATSHAATLLVTSITDSYDGVCNLHCSLRDAVAVANQAPDADTIVLLASTYTLTRPLAVDGNGMPIDDDDHQLGDLDVLGELRIRGLTTIASRIQGQFNDRLFEVRPGAKLTLAKLTLEGGNTAHNGGAVENHGELVLQEVLAQNNGAVTHASLAPVPIEQAFNHGQGGAIANLGELTVQASRLQNNYARGEAVNQFDGNTGRGGAIFNRGSLLIRDSLLRQNAATEKQGDGGQGIALYNLQGNVTVERTMVAENGGHEFAGAAVINHDGELSFTNSTLTRNGNGALFNYRSLPSTQANATLISTTVAGNVMGDSTAVGNNGNLVIHNSIIAGNYSDISISEVVADCWSAGPNSSYQAIGLLISDESSTCSADYFVPVEDTFTTVLNFTPTQHNGTVWTLDLRPGSPAIDAAIGDCPDHDQRGASRPQDGNGDQVAICDLGAYELTPP